MRTNIMHDQPLIGPGMVYRQGGDYVAGEYPLIKNIDMLPDGLRVRTPQRWTSQTAGNIIFPFWFLSKVISTAFDSDRIIAAAIGKQTTYKSLISRIDGLVALTNNAATDQWNTGSGSWYIPWVAFEYNNVYYTIGQTFATGSGSAPAPPANMVVKSSPSQIDSATSPTVTTLSPTMAGSGRIVAAAILKDRVFVARDNTVVWSKATDPKEYNPLLGGGFFKIPDTKINHILAFRESLYIFCSTGIWLFTYSGDPGTSGVLKQVIDNLHFTHGNVIQGTPVGITNTGGVYAITNGFAQLLVSTFDLVAGNAALVNNRVVPWHDGFIILRTDGERLRLDGAVPTLSYVFYFNLETNALVQYDFFNGSLNSACVIDIMNYNNSSKELLAISIVNPTLNTAELVYLDPEDKTQTFGLDVIPGAPGGNANRGTTFDIKFPMIVPDGLEWEWKTFRHIFLEGFMGTSTAGTKMWWSYENGTPSYPKSAIFYGNTPDGLTEYSYRQAFMQKAKFIWIRFSNVGNSNTDPNNFRLNTLKIIWGSTTRVLSRSKGSAE